MANVCRLKQWKVLRSSYKTSNNFAWS